MIQRSPAWAMSRNRRSPMSSSSAAEAGDAAPLWLQMLGHT